MRSNSVSYSFQVYTIGNDEEVHPFVRTCQSANSSYFKWTLILLEGAMLSFGAFLAFETRHVRTVGIVSIHMDITQ